MGFLSCLCGSSGDEKPDIQEKSARKDALSTSESNERNHEKTQHRSPENSDSTNNQPSRPPHDAHNDSDQKYMAVPEIRTDEAPEQETIQRLASTRPTDSPDELSREPEEAYGKQFLITDESIDKQTTGSYQTTRTNTNDPEATEEDRWFETEETYPTHQ